MRIHLAGTLLLAGLLAGCVAASKGEVRPEAETTATNTAVSRSTLAARTGNFAGRAVVAGASEHSGTTVSAVRMPTRADAPYHAVTAADGSFTLSDLPYGEYFLLFQRPNYPPVSSPGFKLDVPSYTAPLATLVREPAGVTALIGQVRLWGASEHAGVTVTATTWGHTGNAVTGLDGSFAFTAIPPGFYWSLAFGAPGYAPVERQALVEEGLLLTLPEVWLYKYGSVVGRVLMLDGHPPAAAVATLTDGYRMVRHAQTDAQGGYLFKDLPPGRYWVGATLSESIRTVQPGRPCIDAIVRPNLRFAADEIVIGSKECG